MLRAFGSLGGEKQMLWALIVILFALWLILFVGKVVVGGLVHVLLVLAVIVLIVRLFTGRTTPTM
jgi:Family of unknown function (DUF5670)